MTIAEVLREYMDDHILTPADAHEESPAPTKGTGLHPRVGRREAYGWQEGEGAQHEGRAADAYSLWSFRARCSAILVYGPRAPSTARS